MALDLFDTEHWPSRKTVKDGQTESREGKGAQGNYRLQESD